MFNSWLERAISDSSEPQNRCHYGRQGQKSSLEKRTVNMETYLSLVSALTALVAVLVGPAVQLYVAKRQITGSTVATFRQQWINARRDEIAAYIGEWSRAAIHWQRREGDSEDDRYDRLQVLARHESKIALLINPQEADHVELMQLIKGATELAGKEFAGVASADVLKSLDETRGKIEAKSQRILKREWNRVKAVS